MELDLVSMRIQRILAFDPGIGDSGWAVLDDYGEKEPIRVIACGHVNGPKLLKAYRDMGKVYIRHYCILSALRDLYRGLVEEYLPDLIGSEGAFHHKFAQVFASLTLCIHTIREVSHEALGKDILVVAPMETKKCIARSHMAGKDLMRASVIGHPDITFSEGIDKFELAEHIYDAIGHGYTILRQKINDA